MATEEVAVEEREFLAEAEVMDLSPIKERSFCVAVASGDPKNVKFLCSTLHGPYNFVEMVQEVGDMWAREQHHAKVIVLDKDYKTKVQCLDENTVDYIEAHYLDIMVEETLAGIQSPKTFTCTAGTVDNVPPAESK